MKTFYSIFLLISAFFISFPHGLQAQITATQCIINSSMYGSAIGYKTTATGKYSFASGYGVRALADHSFIFGTVPGGRVIHGSAIISNNTKNSFLIAFGGKPLFMAKLAPLSVQGNPGNSTQGIDPNTEEDYSGVPAVGIGTIDPQETLDVRGNVKADTVKINHSIFISGQSLSITQRSPGTWGGGENPGTLEIETDTLSSTGGGIALPVQNEIKTLATMEYNDGPKFGIGTTDPQAALHVNGQGRFENTVRIKDNQSGIINAALFVGGNSYITEGGLMIGKTSLSRNLKLQVDGNFCILDASAYSKGVYFIEAKDGVTTYHQKIIIQ